MRTRFNGHISTTVPLKCGVPQGSVIGPILFLCYINFNLKQPISILPLPGKILEIICTNFLLGELEANNILSEYQFGFRRGLSTSHAIFHYVKHIVDGINNKDLTAAIYLDFARAFDSVNFRILEQKLELMGISNMLRKWISGYLKNRQMRTRFNGHISTTVPLKCGVPQGSVIGPILFLCYINDIVSISNFNQVQISLYANDAVLYCTTKNIEALKTKLQSALNGVTSWCKNNCVNLNVKKTKLCCYGTRHILNQNRISLTLNGVTLVPCRQYNYLGVVLDETMTLDSNFNCIFKRFSYKIFQLSKISGFLNSDTRILIYKQTVLPLVEYVSFMLYLNRKNEIDKLQKLQNRALRNCLGYHNPRMISIADLHKAAKVLKLTERREIALLNLLFDLRTDGRYINVVMAIRGKLIE